MSFNPEQDRFRTFGRAKGRTLSPAQTALMEPTARTGPMEPMEPMELMALTE